MFNFSTSLIITANSAQARKENYFHLRSFQQA